MVLFHGSNVIVMNPVLINGSIKSLFMDFIVQFGEYRPEDGL